MEGPIPAFDRAPLLETPRLILRGHGPGDFDDSAAMWADPAVVRHISGTPSSGEASWSRLLRYAGHWALLGFGYWVVVAKDDLRFVGEVGFAEYRRDIAPSLGGRPEAGWVLRAGEHGQGFAAEAVSRMVDWADRFIDSPSTVCIVDPAHQASLRLAGKVGYVQEGQATYAGQPVTVMARPKPPTPR
ncbi:MAG: GNAT family N-acetyltransferase [Inquilinaceae bacterium]